MRERTTTAEKALYLCVYLCDLQPQAVPVNSEVCSREVFICIFL